MITFTDSVKDFFYDYFYRFRKRFFYEYFNRFRKVVKNIYNQILILIN